MKIIKSLLTLVSPGGRRGRLSVLVLHRVLAGPDPLYPEAIDAARFTEMCRWLAGMFTVLPLDQAVRRMRSGQLPPRALSITFDDGYADNLHVATPILQRFGLTATVFVSTGFLDGGCMWNDVVVESFRRTAHKHAELGDLLPPGPTASFVLEHSAQRRSALEAVIGAVKYLDVAERLDTVHRIAQRLDVQLPADLMMRSQDVVALRRSGMQVGAHTVSHPILAKLPADAVRREMQDSKTFLEQLLGEPVVLFAYPNGKPGEDFDARCVEIAHELGFEAAVTTSRGAAGPTTDPLLIPRFTPWDRTLLRFGLRMAATLWAGRKAAAADAAASARRNGQPPAGVAHKT